MSNQTATSKSAKTARSSESKAKKTKTASKTTKSKTTEAKASTTTKSTKTAKKSSSAGITQQQRQELIQEMAYLIAERRGFRGGNPTEDWLLAEHQVDATLLSKATKG